MEALKKALTEIKSRAAKLARNYNNDFMPLYQAVAAMVLQAWDEYERPVVARIKELRGRIEAARAKSHDEHIAEYNRAKEAASKKLRQDLATADYNRYRDEDAGESRIAELLAQRDQLDNQLRAQTVGMAGDEGAQIKVVRQTIASRAVEILVAVGAVLAVMGIEYLTGYGMWQWASDSNIATGLSLITVFGFTILARFTVVYLRRYMAWRDAENAFAKRYGASADVWVFPFPSSDKLMAFGGLALFTVFSLVLLVSRFFIAADLDFAALAAPVGLLFAVLVYGLVEFKVAEPYSKHQMQALASIDDGLTAVEGELATLQGPKDRAADPFLQAVEGIIGEYNRAMDAAEDKLKTAADEPNEYREQMLALLRQQADARDLLEPAYLDALAALRVAVQRHFELKGNEVPVEDGAALVRMVEVEVGSHDPAFADQLATTPFTAPEVPTDGRITDFMTEFRAVRQQQAIPLIAPPTRQRLLGSTPEVK